MRIVFLLLAFCLGLERVIHYYFGFYTTACYEGVKEHYSLDLRKAVSIFLSGMGSGKCA